MRKIEQIARETRQGPKRSVWSRLKAWWRWRGWLAARVPLVTPVDRSSVEMVGEGWELESMPDFPDLSPTTMDPVIFKREATRTHDGYRAFLKTLPDLTASDMLRAPWVAQWICGEAIADEGLRRSFFGRVRWIWFLRRFGLAKAKRVPTDLHPDDWRALYGDEDHPRARAPA